MARRARAPRHGDGPRGQQRRHAARPGGPLRHGALRRGDLRARPLPGGPGRPRPRAGAGAVELRGGGEAVRAGRERGLRAALDARRSRRWSPPCRSATATAGAARSPTTATCSSAARGGRWSGTVSMDNVTVDLGAETDVEVGDEAVLIGSQGDERILCEEVAKRLGTINYEVTCGLQPAGEACLSAGWSEARSATACWGGRVARPRHRRGRRPRAGGARRSPRPRARPGVPALGGVRRLARAEPRPLHHLRLLARSRARRSRRTCRKRDFTVNAMAEPLAGGELIDPHGGERDLRDGRAAGGRAASAYEADPLRALRLVRFAAELGLRPDPETERLTRRGRAAARRALAGARVRGAAAGGGRRAGWSWPTGSACSTRCCPS